jgi:hypothetical protein
MNILKKCYRGKFWVPLLWTSVCNNGLSSLCFSEINGSLKFYMWKHNYRISRLFAHGKLCRTGKLSGRQLHAFAVVMPSTAILCSVLYCITVLSVAGMAYLQSQTSDWVWSIGGKLLTGNKPKYQGGKKNLCQCHFVYHKFHLDCPGVLPGRPRWEADV